MNIARPIFRDSLLRFLQADLGRPKFSGEIVFAASGKRSLTWRAVGLLAGRILAPSARGPTPRRTEPRTRLRQRDEANRLPNRSLTQRA
jgi:hypothetical protein